MDEKSREKQLRDWMFIKGWHTIKLHGSTFQSGLPDLYCMHKLYGQRWIEVKTPTGVLSMKQCEQFLKWWQHGVHVYILTGVSDYNKLFAPSDLNNWVEKVIG